MPRIYSFIFRALSIFFYQISLFIHQERRWTSAELHSLDHRNVESNLRNHEKLGAVNSTATNCQPLSAIGRSWRMLIFWTWHRRILHKRYQSEFVCSWAICNRDLNKMLCIILSNRISTICSCFSNRNSWRVSVWRLRTTAKSPSSLLVKNVQAYIRCCVNMSNWSTSHCVRSQTHQDNRLGSQRIVCRWIIWNLNRWNLPHGYWRLLTNVRTRTQQFNVSPTTWSNIGQSPTNSWEIFLRASNKWKPRWSHVRPTISVWFSLVTRCY